MSKSFEEKKDLPFDLYLPMDDACCKWVADLFGDEDDDRLIQVGDYATIHDDSTRSPLISENIIDEISPMPYIPSEKNPFEQESNIRSPPRLDLDEYIFSHLLPSPQGSPPTFQTDHASSPTFQTDHASSKAPNPSPSVEQRSLDSLGQSAYGHDYYRPSRAQIGRAHVWTPVT